MLDPLTIAYDPDGDPISFSFSGWKEDYWSSGSAYKTTEADIGSHEVYVMVSDPESLIDITLTIFITFEKLEEFLLRQINESHIQCQGPTPNNFIYAIPRSNSITIKQIV